MKLIANKTVLWVARHSGDAIQLTEGQEIDISEWAEISVQKIVAAGYASYAVIAEVKNPVTEDKSINPVTENKKSKEKKSTGDK